MKHNLTLLSACVAASILVSGCSGSSSDPASVTPPATLSEISTTSIMVTDTKGLPLAGVSVSINDNNSGLLARAVGRIGQETNTEAAQKITEYTTDELGFITIELTPGTTSGQFEITIDDPAYFGLTQTYDLAEGGVEETKTLILTKKPAAGETESITAQDEDGNTLEVVTVTSDKTFESKTDIQIGSSQPITGKVATIETAADKKVVAEVVVPDTVTPKTADGAEAQGEITVDAAVYENTTEESIEAFPGGLEVGGKLEGENTPEPVPADEADATDTTGFITAGFVALDVTDEAGKDITQFQGDSGVDIDGDGVNEEGLLVTTLVPRSTINPETGELIKVGEIIPVWSYDDKTGNWTYEGNAKIFDNPADTENWKASFVAEHLTYWNLDYYGYRCYSSRINFKDANTGLTDTRSFYVKLTRPGNGYAFRSRLLQGDGFVQFYNVPRQNLRFQLFDDNGENIAIERIGATNSSPSTYNTSTGYNICNSPRQFDFYLTPSSEPIQYSDVNIEVTDSCSDPTLDSYNNRPIGMSTWMYLYKVVNGSYSYVASKTSGTDGKATFNNLVSSGSYYLYVYDRINYRYKGVQFQAGTASNPVTVDMERTDCKVPVTTSGSTGN